MECGDTADWKFLHKVGEVDIEAGNFSDLSNTLKSNLKDVSGENNQRRVKSKFRFKNGTN